MGDSQCRGERLGTDPYCEGVGRLVSVGASSMPQKYWFFGYQKTNLKNEWNCENEIFEYFYRTQREAFTCARMMISISARF